MTTKSATDAEAMCRLYGTPEPTREALVELSRETKCQGWWHPFNDAIPENFDLYLGLEEQATRIRWYESILVPGLLQTNADARELLRQIDPNEDEELLERRLLVRAHRKQAITREAKPLELDIIIPEAVLRSPIGGPEIMTAQLRHLREMSEHRNISLRVVPFAAGLHAGLRSGSFELLDFPEQRSGVPLEPTTVYIEALLGRLYYDADAHPDEVRHYADIFAGIAAAALDPATSRAFIADVERDMRHGRAPDRLA